MDLATEKISTWIASSSQEYLLQKLEEVLANTQFKDHLLSNTPKLLQHVQSIIQALEMKLQTDEEVSAAEILLDILQKKLKISPVALNPQPEEELTDAAVYFLFAMLALGVEESVEAQLKREEEASGELLEDIANLKLQHEKEKKGWKDVRKQFEEQQEKTKELKEAESTAKKPVVEPTVSKFEVPMWVVAGVFFLGGFFSAKLLRRK